MTTHDFAARLQKAVADGTAIDALDVPDLATGYAVQRELRTSAGPLVGWKLGVTSRAKQAQVGVDSPVYGFLEGANALDVGAPLDTSALIQPRCEPEIVFVLGRDLAGPSTRPRQPGDRATPRPTPAPRPRRSSPAPRRRGAGRSLRAARVCRRRSARPRCCRPRRRAS